MEAPLPMPSTPGFQETLPPCTKRHPCGSCSISPLTLVPPCQPGNGESTQRPWAQCCEHRLWSNSRADPAVRTLTDSGSPKATVLHIQFLPDVQAKVLESHIHSSLPSQGQPPLPPTPSPALPPAKQPFCVGSPQSCSLNCAPQDPKAHHCLSPVSSHLQLTHLQPRPLSWSPSQQSSAWYLP